MSNCNVVGCDGKAAWLTQFKVWAKGLPKTPGACATMQTGIVVCDHHKNNPGSVAEFLPPEAQQQMTKVFTSLGLIEPDFANAEWDYQPL